MPRPRRPTQRPPPPPPDDDSVPDPDIPAPPTSPPPKPDAPPEPSSWPVILSLLATSRVQDSGCPLTGLPGPYGSPSSSSLSDRVSSPFKRQSLGPADRFGPASYRGAYVRAPGPSPWRAAVGGRGGSVVPTTHNRPRPVPAVTDERSDAPGRGPGAENEEARDLDSHRTVGEPPCGRARQVAMHSPKDAPSGSQSGTSARAPVRNLSPPLKSAQVALSAGARLARGASAACASEPYTHA